MTYRDNEAYGRNTNSTFKVGDRVLVDTKSNIGVVKDVVSGEPYMAPHLVEPYARNYLTPALPLTELSWCEESAVIGTWEAG